MLPDADVERGQVAVLFPPAGMIFVADAVVHAEPGRHLEIVREEEIVLTAAAVEPQRRERPGRRRWKSQQKVRIRLAGIAVGEGEVAEQIRIRPVVVRFDAREVEADLHVVPSARRRSRDPESSAGSWWRPGLRKLPWLMAVSAEPGKADVQNAGHVGKIGRQTA